MTTLDEIIRGIAITDRRGGCGVEITEITTDSRAVGPGTLFVAIRGFSDDGHSYITQAVAAGAAAIVAEVWDDGLESAIPGVPVILLPDTKRGLALMAANFYGKPGRDLLVAGVTGTNGKTTVTYLLESIMRAASRKVGVIGTVDWRFPGHRQEATHTTPDAVALQSQLDQMREADVSHVVLEVSSHALDQQRVAGIDFKVAGFTNLSQDHLDYHKTLETYFKSKVRLFSEYLRKSHARGRMAVVNVDDPRGRELLKVWGGKALLVSTNPDADADIVAERVDCGLHGSAFRVRTPKGVWDLSMGLTGEHNVTNAVVAIGMALAMGFSRHRITRGLAAVSSIPGRLERVQDASGRVAFVDFAHTPDALARVLKALRKLVTGRLILVFGCGGDRDKEKREQMGVIAAECADAAFVTNDNPRNEAPELIAQSICAGLERGGFAAVPSTPVAEQFCVELDRRAAIRVAVASMVAGDCVLVAGKGHEKYQLAGGEKRSFDDVEELRAALTGGPPPLPQFSVSATAEGPGS